MKILKIGILIVALCAAAYAQTEDLGMGAFANGNGAIKLAVDASLVDLDLKSPYAMFVVYMAAGKGNENIVVSRDGIAMLYKGQEYKMPSVQELRKNYSGQIHDITFYRNLSKAGIISSWIKLYEFPKKEDFFPPLTPRASVAVDEGSMYSYIGFRTKCYFKNPGFEKGDQLTIKVTAKNNPKLTGEVEVTLR
jgi:hypothetical protein